MFSRMGMGEGRNNKVGGRIGNGLCRNGAVNGTRQVKLRF